MKDGGHSYRVAYLCDWCLCSFNSSRLSLFDDWHIGLGYFAKQRTNTASSSRYSRGMEESYITCQRGNDLRLSIRLCTLCFFCHTTSFSLLKKFTYLLCLKPPYRPTGPKLGFPSLSLSMCQIVIMLLLVQEIHFLFYSYLLVVPLALLFFFSTAFSCRPKRRFGNIIFVV